MGLQMKCLALSLGLMSLAGVASGASPRHIAARMPDSRILARQSGALADCRYVYASDIFTSCQQYLWTFDITLDYFRSLNPGISATCDNYIAGDPYCLIRVSNSSGVPVSQDGRCGRDQNFTTTCTGSQFGDCCGSGGYCGSGSDFCGIGNCQEGGCEGDVPYSTDGTCGRDNDYTECPPKFGGCCSAFGFCGSGADFCGEGRQSGNCTVASSSTSSTSPGPTPTPGGVSRDGTCGYNNQLVCIGSTFGDCCSAAGYCGSTEYECSGFLGCQSAFGRCNGTTTGGSTRSSSAATRTSTQASSSTSAAPVPSPTQPDSIDPNCNRYKEAVSGDYCYIFAENNGITTAQLYGWNRVLGSDGSGCGNLFAGYYYCVGVSQ